MRKEYRAVCFDLDGTLLPMDIDEFLGAYFKDIAAYVERDGRDVEVFRAGFGAGVKAMASNDGSRLNADAYWGAFFKYVGGDSGAWKAFLDTYYETEFGCIGEDVVANPSAARAVNALVEKGYPVVLTTQPLFPETAVRQRVRWAGLDPRVFARITHYENSRSIKPKLRYYAEDLAACSLRGEDVLMVGNNTVDDLVFAGLGADVFLATDYLLNPVGVNMSRVAHGSMEEFANWVETLPACSHPAVSIERGSVAPDASEAAFAANVLPGVSDDAPLFAVERDVMEEEAGGAGGAAAAARAAVENDFAAGGAAGADGSAAGGSVATGCFAAGGAADAGEKVGA